MAQGETTSPRTGVPEGRDLTLDLVRVMCVVLVVFVHILFTGVGFNADGSLLIEKTVETVSWFGPASWVLNIMPLFFVVGGFAARAGWRSTLRKGGDADSFVRVRLVRLARPALPVFVFFAVALGVAWALQLGPDLDAVVGGIATGVGSPLWFLAAYLIAQACAPMMIRLHERAPWVTLAVLALAAVAVDLFVQKVVTEAWGMPRIDLTTYDVGSDLFGLPNVLFVWLFAQQVGFLMYDGFFRRRRRWTLVAIVVGAYGLIWALVQMVPYDGSMLRNQWPPTVLMGILAVAQAAALTLLQPMLAALMRTRAMQGFVFLIGSRLMTVYLWHFTAILVVTGIQLLLPIPMPAPGSALWWWTRPLFLVVVLALVWLMSLWLVRFERAPRPGVPRFPGTAVTVCAVVAFALPPLAITAYSLDLPLALAGLLGTATALVLVSTRRPVPVVTLAPAAVPDAST